MFNVNYSADNANRPSYIPIEPEPFKCPRCSFVTLKGEPICPGCRKEYPRPEFGSMGESDEWLERRSRDWRALDRWRAYQERKALTVVPPTHPRYPAWMAFRCHLLSAVFARTTDPNIVAHLAAVIVLGVKRDAEGILWFGDELLDEDLGDLLRDAHHDNADMGLTNALMEIWCLLADPIGSRDDILPGDWAIIIEAFK